MVMRFVDRASVPVPQSLVAPAGATATERQSAIDYYGANPPPTKAFGFEQYKHPDVVEALEKLFGGKCAYCESRYAAMQPMDVEHFRPKGCVAGEKHPGYWWLALAWENLLPSCTDCNRCRKQFIVDLGENGDVVVSNEKENSGKKDAFPISGKVRACKPSDSLMAEGALLIDPTVQDPAQHLQWFMGNLSMPVVVAREVDGVKDPMAVASIEVYGLNRLRLVQERGTVLEDLASDFSDLRSDVGLAATAPPGGLRDALLAQIHLRMQKLRQKSETSRWYSAVAMAYVETAEAALKVELEGLISPAP